MRPFFYHKIPLFQQYLDTDEELGLLMVDSVLILLSLTMQTFLWLLEKLLPCWKTHDVLICHNCKTASLLKYAWFKDEPQPWNWFIVEINDWCKTEPQQYLYVCAICLTHIQDANRIIWLVWNTINNLLAPCNTELVKRSNFDHEKSKVWIVTEVGPKFAFASR